MQDIVDKIIRRIDAKRGTRILFHEPGYRSVEIRKENFVNLNEKRGNSRILFIDGGNAELIKAGSFSLQLIRVFFTIYQNNKRVKSEKKEFYSLIDTEEHDGELYFTNELFKIKGEIVSEFKISSLDKSLMQGSSRVSVSSVGNVIRRFAELDTAAEAVKLLDKGDIIIIDGDLKAKVTGEKEKLANLYDRAKQKGVIIGALAKTTELFTDKGGNALSLIHDIAPEGMWHYPAAQADNQSHKAEIFFVKLNCKSEYIFKFELHDGDASDVLGILSWNSKDPVFKGYPYGLIEADRFARVQNSERDYYLTMLMSKAGKKWDVIKRHANTGNAHDILDNIS